MKAIYILLTILMVQISFAQLATITQSPIPIYSQNNQAPQITNSTNQSSPQTTTTQIPVQLQTLNNAEQALEAVSSFLPIFALIIVATMIIKLLGGVSGIFKTMDDV